MNDLVPLEFSKLMQTRSYAVIVLGNSTKKFAIYTEPSIGRAMQNFLTQTPSERPLTHDLMHALFRGMHVAVKHVIINDVRDTIYYSRLYIEQKHNDITSVVEVDARPSDCILLALMHNAPIYCTQKVLHDTIPLEN